MHVRSNLRVSADDDVPAEIRRVVARRAEAIIEGEGPDDYVEVTIRKRKGPGDIYAVHVGTQGDGYQNDFQAGDLDSGRLDLWLRQQGKHLDTTCWCGHPSEDHALPQCTSCEI